MKENTVNTYASTIVTIYKDVVEGYENSLNDLKQSDLEISDVMHEIEFSKPKDMYQGYLMYKSLHELRLKRREAKRKIELYKDMYAFLTSQQGHEFCSKIKTIQSASQKTYTQQESRTYTPRIRTDLSYGQTNVQKNTQPFEDMMREFKKTKITKQKGKLRK